MEFSIDSNFELNNDTKIPIFGLGTWDMYGNEVIKSVKWALETGYRLIDTASFYGNEEEIGKAIQESDIHREDIYLTTKVWDSDQGYDRTLKSFKNSIKKLKIDYIDLYLIHWPRSYRLETWKAMENLYDNGKIRAIGVSNFTINHLKELIGSSNHIPAINQVEFSPFLYQKDLLEYCNDKKIRLEAYCPLTRMQKFNNSILQEISKKYQKSPSQVLLRWGIQHGIIEIPKSSSRDHIIENANIFDFEIENQDIQSLDSVNENFRIVDDPCFYE
ncbi:MAG: aldo/keto reductase [Candidatus Lokiarchaeota archaeon]|nr:aldo/keto reductase [Candidatus Lokiarchaeota archaeon]